VAPKRIDPDAVDTRTSSFWPDPFIVGNHAPVPGSVHPIALRSVVRSLTTRDAAATRPTETSRVVATTGSPLSRSLRCRATLCCAGTTRSVHSEWRTGGRSAEYRTTSITADPENGFAMTTYDSSPSSVEPSARYHLCDASAAHGSAAAPASVNDTHPAPTQPPKNSTEVASPRSPGGRFTRTVDPPGTS
jgi:hypothetical protein